MNKKRVLVKDLQVGDCFITQTCRYVGGCYIPIEGQRLHTVVSIKYGQWPKSDLTMVTIKYRHINNKTKKPVRGSKIRIEHFHMMNVLEILEEDIL